MSLRFICIEVRRNLRCATVFLQFEQGLSETEFLRIHVEPGEIRLLEYSTESCIQVKDHFLIEPNSMSGLTVEECNASFRVFLDKQHEEGTTAAKLYSDVYTPRPDLEIRKGENVTLHCRNCVVALIRPHQFTRILEFPSSSIEMEDFFCHNEPDIEQNLVPQMYDLFYTYQFLVLNVDLLREKTTEKESHIYCGRCLRFLGETLLNSKAAKMWVDSLLMKRSDIDDSELIEVYGKTSMSATVEMMHGIMYDFYGFEPQRTWDCSKLLFEATFPNRQRRYILVDVLEKKLEILRNSKPLIHGGMHGTKSSLRVELETNKCYKVVYRVEEEREKRGVESIEASANEAAIVAAVDPILESPVLAFWRRDMNVHLTNISHSLFSALEVEFAENALLIPEQHRFDANNFTFSYLFY